MYSPPWLVIKGSKVNTPPTLVMLVSVISRQLTKGGVTRLGTVVVAVHVRLRMKPTILSPDTDSTTLTIGGGGAGWRYNY